MSISTKPAFIPNRALVGKPTPVVVTPAPQPAVSRLDEQKQAAQDMLGRLASDTRLAAIMLNPVFAPQANAIAWRATGRAIARYETEVPQRDFNALMAEEQGKARKEIEALPKRYADAIQTGAQVTGDAIVTGAVATGNAVAAGAKATGNAVVTGAKAVGNGLLMGGAALFGGLLMGGKYVLKGVGSGLSGLGNLLQNAGSSIQKSSQ
jgi:hypothetical protein